MPFYPVVVDKRSPYRVLRWFGGKRELCPGPGECPEAEQCPQRSDDNTSCPLGLELCPDVTKSEREKFLYYVALYVETGKFPPNKQKFKPIENRKSLFAMKPSAQLRVVGGFRGKDFIIVACCRKKREKYPPDFLGQCEKLWQECGKEKIPAR